MIAAAQTSLRITSGIYQFTEVFRRPAADRIPDRPLLLLRESDDWLGSRIRDTRLLR